jgi:hypothetical protein
VTPQVERIVDNRVFLLGLDKLYRDAMKTHERTELLACARRVTSALHLEPAAVPVEGYYAEEPALTEYFLLMRTLQGVRSAKAPAVQAMPELRRLVEVTSAPLFGKAVNDGALLPTGQDPLSQALSDTRPDWTLARLVSAAHDIATRTDDISLVGLAARIKDATVLTATRESVVLYAQAIAGARREEAPRYAWQVAPALEQAARRFVAVFNKLFNETLPTPEAAQAARYWGAAHLNHVHGRCVRLGYDDTKTPMQHYHWAIGMQPDGTLAANEFWSPEIWTTDRYRSSLGEH